MSDTDLKLAHAPIVEAVLDIDCDMPPAQEVAALETVARDRFHAQYPKFRTQFQQGFRIERQSGGPPQFATDRPGVQAFRFLQEDERQLVQVRARGFSFNRLAPYTSLDDYLPEIERTWRLFVGLAAPTQIRSVRLRYINRILLPLTADRVELDDYLAIGPRLPDEERLTFVGFLNQHTALEADTGNQVNIILTTQSRGPDVLPLIFDITALREESAEPENWDWIVARIQSLRRLKNRVFKNSLTERCLELLR